MTEMLNGSDFSGISVHNFSDKILEQVVHFHVMKLDGGFFLWVGSAPVLSNLAVSMSSKYVSKLANLFAMFPHVAGSPKTSLNMFLHYYLQDSMPLSTLVMGDPSNTAANSLAQRLGKGYFQFLLYHNVYFYMNRRDI